MVNNHAFVAKPATTARRRSKLNSRAGTDRMSVERPSCNRRALRVRTDRPEFSIKPRVSRPTRASPVMYQRKRACRAKSSLLEISEDLFRQWVIEVVGNNERARCKTEGPGFAHRLDRPNLRHGPIAICQHERLALEDAMKETLGISLHFFDRYVHERSLAKRGPNAGCRLSALCGSGTQMSQPLAIEAWMPGRRITFKDPLLNSSSTPAPVVADIERLTGDPSYRRPLAV
jgi:hypothetical protein